ncbi:OmpA family protein [Bacteroides sp.]|uniref:OmpA family protein n=1 Tax=Bacteroides sp. TaxID=29523 RepID=UPI00258FA834|nr:OmpA family protein [Bacteroides sp.]
MNRTTETGQYRNGRMFALLLFVCSFLPNVQAQNGMEGKPMQVADSVRTVYSDVIYFSLNNGDWIEPSEYKKAGRMLRRALSDTITPIVITGWADESGTAAFNEELSLRRARTVRNYLVKKGVAPERITFEGCGIDTEAESPEKARRADVRSVVRLTLADAPEVRAETEPVDVKQEAEPVPVKQETEAEKVAPPVPEKETVLVAEQQQTETPLKNEEIQQAEQQIVAASPRSQNIRTAYRWYAGIELGMPLGVSTFTSFASAGKVGFEGGVLGGYRISPLFSVEAGISLGSMWLGASKCCSDYWLGADGVRYLSPVAGMDSYSYRDIHSSVSVQQYALRLNVELLQIVRPDWDKRWSLTVSPAIYGIGTQATLKENGTKTTIVKRDGRFQFGAGAAIGGSYQVTGNLGIGLRSGVVWVFGERFDGITPTDHKENMIWNNTVTLIWRFGSNK